jgi:hypothetical protein
MTNFRIAFVFSILLLSTNLVNAQSIMIELDESLNGKEHSLTITSLKEKKATTTTYTSVEDAKLAYLGALDERTARLHKVQDTSRDHLTINGNEIIRHSVLIMPDIPRGMHVPPSPPSPPGMDGQNGQGGGQGAPTPPAPPAPPSPRK